MTTSNLYFVSHVTGNVTTPNNALGAPDNVWTADGNLNNSWTSRWRLGTVADSEATGTQTIVLRVRKGGNTGNPSITSVTLWQANTQIATLSGGSSAVTNTAAADREYTFNGNVLNGTMTNVDIQVAVSGATGGPSARNSVEIDSCTWQATYEDIVYPSAFGHWAINGVTM
jgi:hypothetical protein